MLTLSVERASITEKLITDVEKKIFNSDLWIDRDGQFMSRCCIYQGFNIYI